MAEILDFPKQQAQEPQPTPDYFREGLTPYERPWYDLFIYCNGRKPEHMWELMCWSAGQQEPRKSILDDPFPGPFSSPFGGFGIL